MLPVCLIIAGPTAVGKTQLAVDVAKHFHTEIISADSRQCYHELNIGVARPEVAQLQQVIHHFIAEHSIHESITAADFERIALDKLAQIFQQNNIAVVAGGTGLYLRALEFGLDNIPAVDVAVRDEIMLQYERKGIAWLYEKLTAEDSLFASAGEMQNPHRMMRALEVIRGTGQSILSFHRHEKTNRPFDCIKIGLELPREQLYDRINKRVLLMMEQGLEAEAKAVFPFRELQALQTVGYTELFDYFDGEISSDTAVELIQQHSRNYAKRQITWLKKEKDLTWLPPDAGVVIDFIETRLKARVKI